MAAFGNPILLAFIDDQIEMHHCALSRAALEKTERFKCLRDNMRNMLEEFVLDG